VPAAQLPLDLAGAPTYLAADFVVSDSNRVARDWISRWPAWPSFALAISGPAGSGKTHLARIFGDHARAPVFAAADLTLDGVPGLAKAPAVAIEDADRGFDETALLHLHNLLRESGRSLLLTARIPPSRWTIALPDLRSRLTALPHAAIDPPDDGLLRIVLAKLFADRQIRVRPVILSYLVARMERSFECARLLVAELDKAALSGRRPVTIAVARDVLAKYPEGRQAG
jgi:chromosomal replication initiation ATPase DnaA